MKRLLSFLLVLALIYSCLPMGALTVFAVEVDVETGDSYVDMEMCFPCMMDYIPATCTEPSYCPGCGTTGNSPLGHDWSSTIPSTCKRCGAVEGATGHQHSGKTWFTITEATCTTDGMKARICDYCGETEVVTVPAYGHSGNSWFTITQTTCTTDGMKARICDVCGETEVVTVAAYGHSYQTVVTAPTCTAQGYTAFTCSRCGDSYVDSYVSAKGHKWSAWIQTKAPSCTADGSQLRFCNCGASETESIPMKGHTWSEWIQTQDPTCTQEGALSRTCTCGACETESIPMLDHTYVDEFCTVCGASEYEIIASGICGADVTWTLNANGTLTISGTGSMSDFNLSSFCCPWDKYSGKIKSIMIKNGVTSIGDYAFYDCYKLTSITIPDSVTSIGRGALEYCTSLTSITIPDSVTSIDEWTFFKCTGLTGITIPDSVTSIGYGTFFGCSSLEAITIPFVGSSRKDANSTYQVPFGYIFGSSSYPGGVATEQYYYGSSTSSTTSTTYYIPASLKSVTVTGGNILRGAFYNCSNLTSITIPDSVTSIGDYAFLKCTSLTSITIPDSVTSIGYSAFSNCRNLASITIPDSVTRIYTSAFYNCSSLTSITIPDSVTSIGGSAFSGCTSLTSITIPNSITSIGSTAFYNCSSLTSITIPDSVTSIGGSAFSGCSSLTSVTYCGTEEQWNQISIGNYNTALTSAVRNYHNWNDAVCEKDKLCTICGEIGGQWPHTYANGVCSACGILESSNWALTADAVVDIGLTEDLYIDLNGYDLTGSIALNGHKIYGMDSATNAYTCDWMGYFSCVDENGNAIIPESLYATEDLKRYMTVETNDGYTFHRFYLGITNMSLAPSVVGFGYKAEFYGDGMVQDRIDSIGFDLWLTEDRVISRTTAFKNIVTLRLKNFDVINYGETPVNACVTLTLTDGTVIESATASYSMRQMVEQINDTTADFARATIQQVALMILNNQPMETWQVANILACLRPQATVSSLAVTNETMRVYNVANGQWNSNSVFTLDSAYIFDAQDTVETAMAGPYAKWLADYYVTIDGVVQEGLYLAGNYDGWGWITFEIPAGEQYNDYGLLTNSIGAITYTEVVRDVNRFYCGFADTLGKNAGATITVQLRLTNPDDPTDVIVVNTTTLPI